MRKIVTSESVNCGHPDKTCDIIADAFLDEALRQDKNSQMAVECAIKDDLLMIYGEATTKAKLNYEKIAADILLDIGYMNQFKFIKTISQQSAEINKAVVKKTEVTANDQGIMYGYATNETPEFMPISVVIAHKLMKRYDEWRRGTVNFLADAKSQVSVEYDGNKPTSIHTILVSVSHTESATHNDIVRYITEQVVRPVLDEY
ncbi:MAG: methionine adenosyltransferase, partial [Firmicutes bacterium]|nr:methionine adenosyltransferase [Bacillota bacterium]